VVTDTQLEHAGAQFLVLGELLVRGVETHKTYLNTTGYDLVASNGEDHRSCRMQVKCQTFADADRSIPLENPHCDFIVVVRLNIGRGKRTKGIDTAREFFIIPTAVAYAAMSDHQTTARFLFDEIDNCKQYQDAWHLISEFLWIDMTRPETQAAPTWESLSFGTSP
jgi:hypothetical protein